MISAVLLLVLAGVVALAPGSRLVAARWPNRHPRLGVTLWLALSFTAVSSVMLAVAVASLRLLPASATTRLDAILARCSVMLPDGASAPALLFAVISGLVGVGAVSAGAVRLVRDVRRDRQARAQHRAKLSLVGYRDDQHGIVIIDDPRPAAYCVPGRRRKTRVVVTSGALRCLDEEQLQMVIAHELAHARQAHALVAQLAAALGSLGFIPLFAHMFAALPRLLEMSADDAAVRSQLRLKGLGFDGRGRLADALVAMISGTAATPLAAMGAATTAVELRVARLVGEEARNRPLLLGTVIAAIGASLFGPVVVAASPAVCATLIRLCPFMM